MNSCQCKEITRRLNIIEHKLDNLMAFKWLLIGQGAIVSIIVSALITKVL